MFQRRLLLPLWMAGWVWAAPAWRAGASKVEITPAQPMWMAGFAARTKPSEGALAPIYVKALALEDSAGRQSVLVTADILGFTDRISEAVSARVRARHGIPRERLIFNGSHTHWGPVIDRQLQAAYPMSAAQWAGVDEYSQGLEDRVAQVIDEALARLTPARLGLGETTASFASNYRLKTAAGYIHQANPEGPVDRTVPLLRVDGEDGKLVALVFGYACHPTVASSDAAHMYQFHGDYAGFAQAQLEAELGATALFVQGFGGDAKAEPRGTLDLSRRYGQELAANVAQAARGKLTPVAGPLTAVFDRVTLELQPPAPRAEWEKRAAGANPYVALNARVMLATLDREGRIPTEYRYPIQVWQFGQDLTWIAMGGETLVDYNIRFRQEFGPGKVWLSGYNNDVSCYIPPARVIQEGGYEPVDSMIYYARPGPFALSIEERIVAKTRLLVAQCRARSARR